MYILPDAVKRCDADELWSFLLPILVFTSDGVVVGVAIKSVERNDLVKIKPTEPEALILFHLPIVVSVSSALSESQAEAEE